MSKLPHLKLQFVGGWGDENFFMACGWLAANLRWRSAPGSEFIVHTGTGYRDNVDRVAKGIVDVGITTPFDLTLEWAVAGKHMFKGTPYPHLRSLGYLPHDDRLVFAVHRDTGLHSFEDLRKKRYPLRIATGMRDNLNVMTFAVMKILLAHGINPEDIVTWGGKWLEHDHPRLCLPIMIRGEANAVFHEGTMVPQWHELVEKVPVRFIPMEKEPLDALSKKFGFRAAVLSKEHFNIPEDVPCIDWSNWVIFVRDDMPEEIAYMITSVMVEERDAFESRYRHLPIKRSPLTYPIDPYRMCKGQGAPLHPGAERYYREKGYLR
jgi:uncharacterized protein